MRYTACFTIFLSILGLFIFVKTTQAQTISPQISTRIPTIDPLLQQEAIKHTRHMTVCPPTKDPKIARCFAHVILNDDATPFITAKPAGLGPAELRSAYSVTGKASGTPVVAIVDAYDQANMLSDLNTYSATFNLPQFQNCSTAISKATTPCFAKVDQKGGTNYPKADAGWALEISLDVEAVHAMCDNCSILLVEATSPSMTDLMKAVDTATNMGTTVISNSYGGAETADETSSDSHFNTPGIAIMASSGDDGYGVSYPAASQYVIAVGGTKLTLSTAGIYKSETAWTGSGSGCSSYEKKPTWQKDTGCSKRTVADISADADPTSGAAVYDRVKYNGKKGWFKIGGTSLSSPLTAGIFATSESLSNKKMASSFIYALSSTHFHDVTKGSNGTCGSTYLCTAKKGYDGPTGLGSANGMF